MIIIIMLQKGMIIHNHVLKIGSGLLIIMSPPTRQAHGTLATAQGSPHSLLQLSYQDPENSQELSGIRGPSGSAMEQGVQSPLVAPCAIRRTPALLGWLV